MVSAADRRGVRRVALGRDSAAADVRVVRTATPPPAAAGDGAPYQPTAVRAVARHEMGHVLGLAHHAAATSVMAPLVRAERIGDEDGAVLRALHALPAGARRRRGVQRSAAEPARPRAAGPELAFPPVRAAAMRRRIIDNWRRARCSRGADAESSVA
jgi:hypothetical protein